MRTGVRGDPLDLRKCATGIVEDFNQIIRLDHNGVLTWLMCIVAVDYIEEHPMQMDGMGHHRVVDHGQA